MSAYMTIIDSKVVNGKLYVLYQKKGGNFLAMELLLRDYDISFTANPRYGVAEQPVLSGDGLSGHANFVICGIQSVPPEWLDRVRQSQGVLTEDKKILEAPNLQIEYKTDDVEWKEI